jgi:uncharacterized protein
MAKYRILSIDGGGIRGLIPAIILQRLEAETKLHGWFEKTDLIAGTSTGGILALGLAYGLTPDQLIDLYSNKGPAIFETPLWNSIMSLGTLVGAKHPNQQLQAALEEQIHDALLKDLKKKVLISSFKLKHTSKHHGKEKTSWKAKFFHNYERTNPAAYDDRNRFDRDGYKTAVEIAMYTSAAPTYFPSCNRYIDGGVVANNPGMAAIAQTQDKRYKIDPRPALSDIVMLSLGTGASQHYIDGENLNWGYAEWGWKVRILNILMDSVVDVPDYQCHQLLGKHYKRLNPELPANENFELDDASKIPDLIDFAYNVKLGRIIDWLDRTWCPEA